MSAAVTLPDGRRLTCADELDGVLRAALCVVTGVAVGPGEPVRPALEALASRLREQWAGLPPSRIPPLQEARRLYHAVGIQPTRIRPSSEALLRRILKGQGLYTISNVVDACNLASLEFLLPIGLYDLARVAGDIELRIGREGEEYPGIRKGPVHLVGRLGLFDREGPFGSPTSDSARTAVGPGTRDLLGVVMATADYPADRLRSHAARLGELLTIHAGGKVVLVAVLDDTAPAADGEG